MVSNRKNGESYAFDSDEAFCVTCGALRYNLGWHSYSPSLVWGLIKRHWNDPMVKRQRECVLRDIEEYLAKAKDAHDGAVEANEGLAALETTITEMVNKCRSPYGSSPLNRILAAVKTEIAQRAGFVPEYPDMDIETTWAPAVAWIKEHMNDNIENEG